MLSTGITIGILGALLAFNIHSDFVILVGVLIYSMILGTLLIYLNKKSVKEFSKINV